MPREITEDYIKEKINSWFLEEGNKHSISTFLKSLILQKINEDDMHSNLHLMKKVCDRIDVSISLLVSDFFLQNYFHYTLSVFSSEIFSTAMKDYVCDYFKKISYGWDPKKLPTLDYTTVYKILLSLDINPNSSLGADIINRYYLLTEGSLLKIIISILKKTQELKDPQIVYAFPCLEDKCVGTDDTLYSTKELEDYFIKKEVNLKRKISLQQREFTRCRKILSSCHDALKDKLQEAQNIIIQLNEEKNYISKELELARKQCQLIADVNDKLSVFSEKCGKVEDSSYFHNTSSKKDLEKSSRVFENVGCQTEFNYRNASCQSEFIVVNEHTDTDDLVFRCKSLGTQTDCASDNDFIRKFEEEKLELTTFIEQLQGRINILTEKTIALNKIIVKFQSVDHDNVEVQTSNAVYESSSDVLHTKKRFKCCKQFDSLTKIVECHSFCIDTLKNKLKFIKDNSDDTDEKLKTFITNQTNW